MIDRGQLISLAGSSKNYRQLEKEYLLTLLLYTLYSRVGGDLVFKGGTALKMFYNLNRFSEDLDFSYVYPSSSKDKSREIMSVFSEVLKEVNTQYGVLKSEVRTTKGVDKFIGVNYEIRVKGPLFDDRNKQLQNINIDFSLRDDMLLKAERKYIAPIYPDIPTFSLYVMSLDEILSEKFSAILERNKMRDVYDAYFILRHKEMNYNEDLVTKKMGMRNESFDRSLLIKKLQSIKESEWKSEMSYLVSDLPDYLQVTKYLIEKIEPS